MATASDLEAVANSKILTPIAEDTLPVLVDRPECPLSVPSFANAEASYREVRARAGAFPRDRVDRRFVQEVGELGLVGSGSLKHEPGALEPVSDAPAYEDVDGDGMADRIEERFGAKVGRDDAWATRDDDGWSSFDRFMEWLSQERLAGRYPD